MKQYLGNNMRIMWLMLLTIPLVLSFSCNVSQDFKSLSAEALKKMIDEETKILIVDARSEHEYIQGHMPGAINIPQEEFDNMSALLPKDKSIRIVFYCRGYG